MLIFVLMWKFNCLDRSIFSLGILIFSIIWVKITISFVLNVSDIREKRNHFHSSSIYWYLIWWPKGKVFRSSIDFSVQLIPSSFHTITFTSDDVHLMIQWTNQYSTKYQYKFSQSMYSCCCTKCISLILVKRI